MVIVRVVAACACVIANPHNHQLCKLDSSYCVVMNPMLRTGAHIHLPWEQPCTKNQTCPHMHMHGRWVSKNEDGPAKNGWQMDQ